MKLKQYAEWFILFCWTVAIVAGVTYLYKFLTKTKVYVGEVVKFNAEWDHSILISGKDLNFQAESSEPFSMEKISGEKIDSFKTTPPFGWTSESYYFATSNNISAGKWYVSGGYPTITITSHTPVTAQLDLKQYFRIIYFFFSFPLALYAWCAGLNFLVLTQLAKEAGPLFF